MADRLLVDLDGDGLVTVGIASSDGRFHERVSRRQLTWPLDEVVLEDLRWYLEDYLRAPFGVWEGRGPQIKGRLAGWGESVFAAVFSSGPTREAYRWARDHHLELVFRSAEPTWLGLPWELMRDGVGPTALRLAGVNRALPVADLPSTAAIPGGRLRVLMVISRPAGVGDVGYRMIARPLLERLAAVHSEVDLVVLRPPTLDTLREVLAGAREAGEPFHVVHFDGHGALPGGHEGLLILERRMGGPHPVSASKMAVVLKDAGVPVVVLNACQSGAVGTELGASVATALIREGATSVVAMAYNVHTIAAAEFMAVFYEHLFAGNTISTAVTAGRKRLFERPGRPSPRGELPLADWLVPVHYMRADISFPQVRGHRPAPDSSLNAVLDQLRVRGADGEAGSLDPVGSFVGRDDLFYELETAARLQRVVVLQGPGGTGKSELAKAFGRWWRDTGGVERRGWVQWHSFEPGVASFGLDGVITSTGLQVFGPEFAQLNVSERQMEVESLLAHRRLLLIWDNFEAVHSMPDPAGTTPALDNAGCAAVKGFLARLTTHGSSAVIITSRTAEDWLGPGRRIEVGGLAREEAIQYADQLLAPYPAAAPRRARRAFGELLEWLDGHPLSMRLILPRLDSSEPEALLEGLRGTIPLPDGEESGALATSLAASITYSFSHLAEITRRLLPAVCLFHSVTMADALTLFSGKRGVPGRFAGASGRDWAQALEDAARVGLLAPLGSGMYRIHPALPAYLAAEWRAEDPDGHNSIRDTATRALAVSYADLGDWLNEQIRSGDAGFAYAVIELQQHNLGALLGYAIDHQMWEQAQMIAQPLSSYWEVRGLDEEADAWTDRVQRASEDPTGTPPWLDTSAGALWVFITGAQADRQQRTLRLNDAEHTCRRLLDMFNAQPVSPQQQSDIGTFSHNLGIVIEGQGRLDEAEGWHRKSLAIFEDLGNRPGMAASYYQLGMIAQHQGRLEDGEDWYRKSVVIEADLGNRPGMANSYHQLGIVAHLQGRLDEAEGWHRKSLAICEDLGNRPGMADSYHELGMIAQDRGRLEDAEDWYRESLVIYESLGNQQRMAVSYGQLGLLAEQRGQPRQALEWTIRCVTMFDQFPHPMAGPGPDHLARLTAQLGLSTLEVCWQEVTGSPLPSDVRGYVSASRPGTN